MKRICIVPVFLIAIAAAGAITLELYDPPVQIEAARPNPRPVTALPPPAAEPDERAHFGDLPASADVRRAADWVVRTGDNGGLPFVIIDKRAASLHVFDIEGRAQGATPVLLGIAIGDQFAPGSAEKDMYETRVDERITPAGRFVGEPGLDDKDRSVVWFQYDAGISMHAVLDNPRERRIERLQTATPADNRISYGCVNVPTTFYRDVVRPLFDRTHAIVYVLPDSGDALSLFASTSMAERLQ